MHSAKLSPKQARFVEEYLVDLNATQAALRAGYSAQAAMAIGYENLRKPQIHAAIADAQRARSLRTSITADRVLVEIARLAFADITKLYDHQGRLRPIQDWDPDTRVAVLGIESHELFAGPQGARRPIGTAKKLRLADKTANLALLAKHLGLLTDKREGGQEMSDLLKAVLLEMHGRSTRDVTPEAEWAPIPPQGLPHPLPPPPAPEEEA
jgi:phage terminase small subunit